MFLNNAPAAEGPDLKKRKGQERSKGGEAAVNKMLWNLDFRTRTLEGKVPSYFLAEDDQVIVPAMLAAAKLYDDQAQKGVAHPLGPKRTTLAAGFLNRIALADLSQVAGDALKFMQEAGGRCSGRINEDDYDQGTAGLDEASFDIIYNCKAYGTGDCALSVL